MKMVNREDRLSQPSIGLTELFAVVLTILSSSFFHHWFMTRFGYFRICGGSILMYVIEFITLCLLPTLVYTLFGDYSILVAISLLTISLLLCRRKTMLRSMRTSIYSDIKVNLLVNTVVVIAAVDCKIFASKFAKTTAYGYSPMDLGTGMFVAMRALNLLRHDLNYAKKSGGNEPTTMSHSENTQSDRRAPWPLPYLRANRFTKLMSRRKVPRFIPFFVVGTLRTLFITLTGYYQDPIEYGVHWNFFFTLGILELFVWLSKKYFKDAKILPILSIVVGLSYFCLLRGSIEKNILRIDDVRFGFLDANREGIFSTFGYLFIFGMTYFNAFYFLPHSIFDDFQAKQNKKPEVLRAVICYAVIQVVLYAIAVYTFGPPSRRSANLVYGLVVQLVLAVSLLFVYVYQHCVGNTVVYASPTSQLPTMHAAISRNGTFFFISANLLTGFLNYIHNLVSLPPFAEFLLLMSYMFSLTLGVQYFDQNYWTESERRLFKSL